MEQNPELQLAWQFIEQTGTHLFLTGKAGTGKTTFLRQLKQRSPKRMVVLAPTGIAAINAGGVTIHSFFQLSFAPYVPDSSFHSSQTHYRFSKEKRNIIRSMDLLVIDEISMVRADLLDALDAALRRYRRRDKPFGGVQLLMIGDVQQLAPVVKEEEWGLLSRFYQTPYFFSSKALQQTSYKTIELTKVYRQSDTLFLSLLNKIRENVADQEVLDLLNRRYHPGFQPPKEAGYIRLTTHNYQAQQVNERELQRLPGKAYPFRAHVTGNFPEYSFPTDEVLTLKEGAQIMFVKNDTSADKRYYNGMIGEVLVVNPTGIVVCGQDRNNRFTLEKEEWNNCKYALNESTNEITEEIEGTFRQYPVRLAWAITIHKSQGLTFEHAIIDARNSFAHGQTYVALSRCKTLEGLVLESPLRREAIISDAVVDAFSEHMKQHQPGKVELMELQRTYFLELLNDLFDFYPLSQSYQLFLRLLDEHLYKLYPKLLEEYKAHQKTLADKVVKVAERFRTQYTRLLMELQDYTHDDTLQERIHSASTYFYEALVPLRDLMERTVIAIDNKELRKQADERRAALDDQLWLKESLMEYFRGNFFCVSDYLNKRAATMLELETSSKASTKGGKKKAAAGGKMEIKVPTDILYPQLYHELDLWRTTKARELHLPVYVIIQQKALMGMVNLLPDTSEALRAIPYFGDKGVSAYGLEILTIIRRYMQANGLERPDIKEFMVEKKTQAKKQNTKEVSYELYCTGMSIEAIAKERLLTVGTIEAHLAHYVEQGQINVEDLVSGAKIQMIKGYLAANASGPTPSVLSIKNGLNQAVSYGEINLVMASLPKRQENV